MTDTNGTHLLHEAQAIYGWLPSPEPSRKRVRAHGVCPTGALKPKRQSLLEEGTDPDAIFQQTRRKRKKKNQQGNK